MKYLSDIGINKNPVQGTLDVAGDIYSNGEKLATEARLEPDYSTGEQLTGRKWIDGKSIYLKVISAGSLPNNSLKNVAHNITSLGAVINIYGYYKSGTTIFPAVRVDTSNVIYGVGLYISGSDIVISTGADRTGYSGYIVLEYTKT